MKKLVKSILGLFILVILGSCSSNKDRTVKIGYLPLTANLPLFVAAENGYFKEEGIKFELIKFETSNQMIEALVTNRIDIETAASSSVTLTVAQTLSENIKTFMLNVFDSTHYLSGLIVNVNSDIKTVENLQGKKIGTFPGSTMKLYTDQYLKSLNIAYKEIIQIPAASQLSALSNGSVDALVTLEPTGSIAEANNLGKLLIKAPIETRVLSPWVAGTNSFSKDFYMQNTKLANEIISVFNKSVEWIRSNPDSAKKVLGKYTSIQDSNVYDKLPIPNYWMLEEIQVEVFQKLADNLYLNKDIESKVDVSSILLLK